MTVADRIALWLADQEIRHAFGIIGAGNVALFDAIARLGETEIVSVHHEQAAAMAGAYYYRSCGRVAACLVTTGAGSANAITGVMAAYMDSIPLLVISGNEPSAYLQQKMRVLGVQGFDSARLAAGFTKAALRVVPPWGPSDIRDMDVMLHTALAPRQGPVWIDIPRDVQTHDA